MGLDTLDISQHEDDRVIERYSLSTKIEIVSMELVKKLADEMGYAYENNVPLYLMALVTREIPTYSETRIDYLTRLLLLIAEDCIEGEKEIATCHQ